MHCTLRSEHWTLRMSAKRCRWACTTTWITSLKADTLPMLVSARAMLINLPVPVAQNVGKSARYRSLSKLALTIHVCLHAWQHSTVVIS